MAAKELTVRQWIWKFANYEFHNGNLDVQIEAGWYDWFCDDSALLGKTKRLGDKVIQLAASKKIDTDKMYVWFKNNCPMNGPLYDDIRFADIKTGDVIYNIVPRSGHSGKAEVWGKENGFKAPLAQGTWKDIKKFFEV
jgi:hypothetical protein